MEPTTSSNKPEGSSTSLINYKDDERLMSESLYRNLHVLARFNEPSAEFLLVFQPHMFVKSNAKAFFPVLHFIFNSLDAVEFNKRFRWPLLDKLAETNFRKATVDYMNYLNVTHQLGLETMKLSNIHIPGGLKFIKIIHKFTYLAMKLELNKPEHGSLPDVQNIPDADDMLEKLEEYVERGTNFATRLQVQSDKISKRIDEMRQTMELCFDSDLKEKEICWACLQKEWQDDMDRVVRDDVRPKLEVVNLFSQRIRQLNELLTKLFAEKRGNVIEYDRDQLAGAQTILKQMHPDMESVIDGIVEGKTINFENLFKVLFVLLPKILDKLETFKSGDLEAHQYEFNEIVQFNATATKYQADLNEFEDFIQPFIEKDLENFRKFCQNNFNLPFNIMETPTVTRRPQLSRIRNRLGLLDNLIKKTQLFKPPPVRSSTSRNTSMLATSSCSSLSNTRSRDAALQLLGKPKSRANVTQSSLSNMSSLSKFSSTPRLSSTMQSMTGTRTNPQPQLKFSPSFPMTPTSVFTENFKETTSMMSPTGISVVRKVETSSSVIHLNKPQIRSPSRRFYVTDIPPEFAVLMQQNGNLDAIGQEIVKDVVESISTNGHKETTENVSNNKILIHNDSETAIGTPLSRCTESDELGVELLSNVSDSVLHDISTE